MSIGEREAVAVSDYWQDSWYTYELDDKKISVLDGGREARFMVEWETDMRQDEFLARAETAGVLYDEQQVAMKTYEDVENAFAARERTVEELKDESAFDWPQSMASIRVGNEEDDAYLVRWLDEEERHVLRIIVPDLYSDAFTPAYTVFGDGGEAVHEQVERVLEKHRT